MIDAGPAQLRCHQPSVQITGMNVRNMKSGKPLLHNQPTRSNQLNLPAGGKDGPINRCETDQGVDAVINGPRL